MKTYSEYERIGILKFAKENGYASAQRKFGTYPVTIRSWEKKLKKAKPDVAKEDIAMADMTRITALQEEIKALWLIINKLLKEK